MSWGDNEHHRSLSHCSRSADASVWSSAGSAALFLSHPSLDPLLQLGDWRKSNKGWEAAHKSTSRSVFARSQQRNRGSRFPPRSHGGRRVTWLQHALRERLPVKRVGGGVEQVAQDDGSVHDVPGRQHHGVSHKGVHQGVCRHKLAENSGSG